MRLNIYKLMMLIILVSSSVLSQRMSVQDFHNFTRDQQVETIQSMQMFAVNIEMMHNQAIDRKYSYQTIQKILKKILPRAIANKKKNKVCIYAGWLSYVSGPKERCTHPNNMKKKNIPKELTDTLLKELETYNKFKKSIKDDCSNPKMIVCNPQLFGKNAKGKAFCAEGNKNTQNSSFQCLKKFEKNTSKDKKIILDEIIKENIKPENKNRLDSLLKMIDDTCMCNGNKGLINKNYAKRMFSTQTCFSWTAQVKNITGRACNIKNSKEDINITSIIDTSKKLYEKAKSELALTVKTDDEYIKVINSSSNYWPKNLAFNKERKEKYKTYCKEQLESKPTIYKITISKGKLTKDNDYLITADPKRDDKQIEDLKDYQIQWYLDNETKDLLKSDTENKLTIKLKPEDVKAPIRARLVKNDKEKALSNEIDLANPYSISIADTDKDKEGKNLVATVKKDGKELTLDQLKSYSINWFLKGKEDKSFDQSSISFNTTKFKATKTEDNIVYATLTEVDKKLAESNKLEYKKDEDLKEDYKISIEKKSMQGDKQNLIAKVTLDGKEITVEDLKKDGLSIKWAEILASKKDEAKKDEDKTEEDTEETKDKKIVDADEDGIPDELVTKNEDDKDDSEPKTEIDKNGFQTFVENTDSFEAQAEVFKEKKIVIAKLIKDKKEIAISNEVDFKKSVIAPYQGRQTPQILQPIMGPLLNLGGVR